MFEKYSEYKDSGVEWIGIIPKNWDVLRLKTRIEMITGYPFKSEKYTHQGIRLVRGINVKEGVLNWDETRYWPIIESHLEKFLLREGDVLISMDGSKVGKNFCLIEKNDLPLLLLQRVARLRSQGLLTNRYLYFNIVNRSFLSWVEMTKTDPMVPHIAPDDIKNFVIAIPPVAEQTAIANFLDHKTAQIDQAISIKEKQIELLKERRQILIHNAVTRGLDVGVKMKNSGVEWIGEIPEHWELYANRVLFTERNQPGREGLPLLSVSIHTAISSEELDEESNIRGKVKIEDKSNYKLVEINDIVFNMMRAWQGAIGAVRTNGMVSPAYVVAMPNKKLEANYAEYQYRTSIYIQEMNRVSKGITDFRKRLYWHEFKQLTTILPPFEEQKEIVFYIENINEKIATAMSLKQKEIEKLKEYKSTLINSAVTGKIKVT